MKKYLWMTVAALWMTGCNNDGNELADDLVTNPVTIRATIAGDADARAVLGESDGTSTPVYWSDNDEISLTIGDNTTPYTFATGEVGEKATSADFTCSDAPTLTAGTTITATYPANAITDYSSQPGTADGVGAYIGMTATCTVTDEQSYGDLNLNFENTTAIVRLTLTNTDFADAAVSGVSLKVNDNLTVTTPSTSTFTGASDGSITVYFALPASTNLTDGTITATCGEKSYTASITTDKTLEAGTLYRVNKEEMLIPYGYDEEANTYTVYLGEYLQTAFEAAELTGTTTENPATVKLMANMTVTGAEDEYGYIEQDILVDDGVIILDLNGHTLTVTKGICVGNETDEKGGTLTIDDSSEGKRGKIIGTEYPVYVAYSDLIVNNGNIEGTSYAVYGYAGGSITINGGTFKATTGSAIEPHTTPLTITGGTFEGEYALGLNSRTTLTVTGGSFTGTKYDIDTAGKTGFLSYNEEGTGATFPGGLSIYAVNSYNLNSLLADGAAYYDASGNPLTLADDATSCEGDVTVKKASDSTE